MVSRIPSQGGQILDVLVNSQATPALCHVIQNNTFINYFQNNCVFICMHSQDQNIIS